MQRCIPTAVVVLLATASHAGADFGFLQQARSITAMTSFDGASLSEAAGDFGPFIDTVDLATTFPAAGGGTAINRARAGIDCHLDPNQIRLNGTLIGAGGVSLLAGGATANEFGFAAVALSVDVSLGSSEQVFISSLARPSLNPEDAFKIRIRKSGGGGEIVFFLDESSPPQDVAFVALLDAGNYSIEYEAELTVDGVELEKDFGFQIFIPAPAGTAVLGMLGAFGLRRRR